jgi:hypothetical protein
MNPELIALQTLYQLVHSDRDGILALWALAAELGYTPDDLRSDDTESLTVPECVAN